MARCSIDKMQDRIENAHAWLALLAAARNAELLLIRQETNVDTPAEEWTDIMSELRTAILNLETEQ